VRPALTILPLVRIPAAYTIAIRLKAAPACATTLYGVAQSCSTRISHVEGDCDLAVTEAFANDFGVDTGCERQGGPGVAEARNRQIREIVLRDRSFEGLVQPLRLVSRAGGWQNTRS
jgi:hypothetical protein